MKAIGFKLDKDQEGPVKWEKNEGIKELDIDLCEVEE